jgi:hypothetical protein
MTKHRTLKFENADKVVKKFIPTRTKEKQFTFCNISFWGQPYKYFSPVISN